MKVHIFLVGTQTGRMDIDIKLPQIIKQYPNSKVEKRMLNDTPYIRALNIASGLSFNEISNQKVGSSINIDAYAFSGMCYTLFDVSFELSNELIKDFLKKNDFVGQLLFKNSTITINNDVRAFPVMITEYILPFINPSKMMELSEELQRNDNIKLKESLDEWNERLGFKPYAIDGINSSLSIDPNTTFFILEDFENQINITDNRIESMTNDDEIYVDNDRGLYICKKKDYYKDLWEFHLIQSMYLSQLKMSINHTESFIRVVSKRGLDIRQNIDQDNQNAYYWKKLKKKIEMMDLNFLEFHADAVVLCNHNPNNNNNWGTDFQINKKTTKRIKEISEEKVKLLKVSLNEVKYAISNLSTPSHTHDELILQKETEKVNDRILMLSFIAMAVSSIGMMRTNDIEPLFKILSGAGIISLPVLYYYIRAIQRKISKRTNRNNELKRQIKNSQKFLKQLDKELENIKQHEEMPEDFKKEVISFRSRWIEDEKRNIDRLKKKLK